MTRTDHPFRRLGRKIFFRRFAQKISLDEFEQATGVPKSHWMDLEAGKRQFTIEDLQLLSRLLDVSPTWFLEIPPDTGEDFEDSEIGQTSDLRSMGRVPGLMEVMLPNGSIVVVDPDFDADALNRLMGVLEKR
jgi:transcriptional regulator with XRE-family HTH domain